MNPTAPTMATPASLPLLVTHVLLPGLVVLAAAFLAIHPITDPDFWYHAAFGREALRAGHLPRQDIFSYTALGHSWISSGWLSSITLHSLTTAAGAVGPVLLVFVCVAAAALTTYFAALRTYAAPAAAALLLLGALLASYPRFNPRPDILSQFLIVPLVLLLASTERMASARSVGSSRRLWILPVYFVIWANLHALFFLGLAVVALYAGWRVRLWHKSRDHAHLLAIVPCMLCFATWLLNPYGWRLLQFAYDNATLPKVAERVYELKPLLNAETLRGGLPFHILGAIALLLALGGIAYWKNRQQVPPWRAGALALFVFLLFYQRRQIGLAGAAIPALLAPNLAMLESTLRRNRWLAPSVAIAAATLICGLRLTGALEISRGLPRAGVDCEWFPCGAAKFLRENPAPSQLFHDLYTGGYLLHELGTGQKVFIDGRLEIYKDGPWQDYFGPPEKRMTSDELFSKYGVQTCVLDIRGIRNNPGHLANQLAGRSDWLPVYFDDHYCALVRETSATKSYVERHGFRFVNPFNWNRLNGATDDASRAAALLEAQRAVKLAPNSAAANTAMALMYYNRGNRTEGDRYLKTAQAVDPTIELAPQP